MSDHNTDMSDDIMTGQSSNNNVNVCQDYIDVIFFDNVRQKNVNVKKKKRDK